MAEKSEIIKREGDAIQETQSAEKTDLPVTIKSKVVGLAEQAGTIKFSKGQRETLFAPIDEKIVEIRPDGLIYLPWMEYVSRLRDAFNGTWAIIPTSEKPDFGPNRNSLMWGFYLFIEGKPYGYAIGEQAYYENNQTMSWGDACEGAKSNALMRLCKGLGIGIELWRPSFIENWKKKHAETYYETNRQGKEVLRWRKKGEGKKQEQSATPQSTGNVSEGQSPATMKEPPPEYYEQKKAEQANLPEEQAALPEESEYIVDKRSLASQDLKMDINNLMVKIIQRYGFKNESLLARMDKKIGHHSINELTIDQAEVIKEHFEWVIDKIEADRMKEKKSFE